MIEFLSKNYLQIIIGFCTLLYTTFGFNKTASRPIRIITIYLICYFLIETLVRIHAANGWNNHYLSHLFFIPQFIILSFFYKSLFKKNQKKIVNAVLLIVMSILIIQYFINPELFLTYNPLEVLLTCSPIVAYTILHLYNSLTKKGELMYINTGILFYISFTTLLFILYKFINSTNISFNRQPIYLINKILVIGYMLLFLVEYKLSIWKSIKN